MDLQDVIRSLREERDRIDRAIAALEGFDSAAGAGAINAAPGRKRGRKSMTPEERRVVADRMRRYWQQKREQQPKSA